MFLIKLIVKVLVLPLLAALVLLKWIGIFLTSFSSIFFNLIAALFFLAAVPSFVMGLCPGGEALKMLFVSFGFFIIPHTAEWLLTGLTLAAYNLSDFIKS